MEHKIMCYTRQPKEEGIYSNKLAFSMHLAVVRDEGDLIPLNHNSGILYAKAVENPDGTLQAKSLNNPWLFQMADKTFGVIAQRIEPDGGEDVSARGKILLFTTTDLLHYEEKPLLDLSSNHRIEDATCRYDAEKKAYLLTWCEGKGEWFQAYFKDLKQGSKPFDKRTVVPFIKEDIKGTYKEVPEGAVCRNTIGISKELADRLIKKLLPPVNISNELPEKVEVSSSEELNKVKAIARYSDGTSVYKRVDWDDKGIDWEKTGTYQISGRIHQDHYEFPVAWHRADPCVGKWNGSYYFIATNDRDNNHSLFIRKSDTIKGLVTSQEVKILDTTMYSHLRGLLWAPEFHIIKDRLYIFHAGTPGEFKEEQSHVMALKESGDPLKASDWEMPVKVLKKDGSPLYGKQGITLDMTVFEANERFYAVWSQRQFSPVDQGAFLYIAEINPDEPWKLLTDPVLLSRPEYGWANNHTFVDEGPFAIVTKNRIFLTFSSAAVDSTYVVGLLSVAVGENVLDPDNWIKENYPLLSSRSKEGEFGPGHNAYITDEDGFLWNTYHARPGIDGPRSSGIRRVHFDIDGYPVLDLTEDRDLVPELSEVTMEVIVSKVSDWGFDKRNQAINPYLPSWEYIPDGEPYVFGDRVYVYGSHDQFRGHAYCLKDYVCWSAPVDDLSDWRCEGTIYKKTQDPMNRDGHMCLYAPDVTVGPDGRYYLYYVLDKVPVVSVAVCDTPAGTYEFYGYVHYLDGTRLGEKETDEPQFDPGVLTEGKKTYLYTGFCAIGDKSRSGPMVTVLLEDMLTIEEGPVTIAPSEPYSEGSGYEGHEFFEAPSMRKIGDTYYFIYSSIKMHELCYATSKNPVKGFSYGGVIISNNDLHIGTYKPADKPMYYGGNNHGSIVEIRGKWYIFYHRHTDGTNFSRQGCMEEITILEDGTILQSEMTTSGANGAPLKGQGTFPAYLACNLFCKEEAFYTGGPGLFMDCRFPKITQDGKDGDEETGYIANMQDGANAGFKYLECKGIRRVSVCVRGYCNGEFLVKTAWDGPALGTIPVVSSNIWVTYTSEITIPDGIHALYLEYHGTGGANLKSFTLNKEE